MIKKATLRSEKETYPISDYDLLALILQKEESAREKNGDKEKF